MRWIHLLNAESTERRKNSSQDAINILLQFMDQSIGIKLTSHE